MSRALTRREKVFMGILAVLLLVLAYYLAVWQPAQEQLIAIENAKLELRGEIDLETAKSARLKQMTRRLNDPGQEGTLPAPMAIFDNSKNVIRDLDVILSTATEYSLSFSAPEIKGDLVSRAIGVSFSAAGWEDATTVISKFYNNPYRCKIGDLTLAAEAPQDTRGGTRREGNLARGAVQVSMKVTYYELISKGRGAEAR